MRLDKGSRVAHRKCIIIRCNDSLSLSLGSWLLTSTIATTFFFTPIAAILAVSGFTHTFAVTIVRCECRSLLLWLLRSSCGARRATKLLLWC